jgi:cobalt-zinc-cadmium efflux system outer membrane protein
MLAAIHRLSRHIPKHLRFLPVFAIAYAVSPIDAIPDLIPGLGQLDDLAVILLAVLALFVLVGLTLAIQGLRTTAATTLIALTPFLFVANRAQALEEPHSLPMIAPSTSDQGLTPPLQAPPSDQPNKPVNRFSLGLSMAFDVASTKSPDLYVAQENLSQVAADIKAAGAIPNPQIALQYGFGDPYTKTISGNTQQIGLNQLIEIGGKRAARLKVARANYELAVQQLAAMRFDVRSQVRRAYAELAAAEANIELVESQRALIVSLYRIAHKRVEAGAAAEAEEIQAKLEVDQFDTLRTSALGRMRKASAELDYLLGYSPTRDLDVEDNGLFRLSAQKNELVPQPDFNLPAIEELIARAYNQRLDLKATNQQTVASANSLSLAKRQAIPDVLLGSGFVFSTFHEQNTPQQYGAYLNANVDLPVFYQHQGEIARAKATLRQSKLQVTRVKSRIATDVHTAYASLAAARENIRSYQNNLIPTAKVVVRLAQRSYETGRSDLSKAIIAEQMFQTTLSGYFDAVVDYQNSWADLEKAIGAPVSF